MADHISMQNIDNLTEDELKLLEQKYKDEHLPMYRLLLLVPFNLITAGCTMYYTIHFKHYSKKFFKPQQFGFRQVVKYGTLQSIAFTIFYLGGTALLSGIYNPIAYMRGLAEIKGRQVDTALKFDQNFQRHFLFNMMSFFGVSEQVMGEVKNELNQQKAELDKKNYFSKETSKLLEEVD